MENLLSSTTVDWVNSEFGCTFTNIVEINRLEYRLRRNLTIDILNPTLVDYEFEYEMQFPKSLFIQTIDESILPDPYSLRKKERERLLELVNSGVPFRVPVFVTDIMNPRADFEVFGLDNNRLFTPNRYETSEIWGQQLYVNFEQLYVSVNENYRECESNEEDNLSIAQMLKSLAWISGGDTDKRFQAFNLVNYSDLGNIDIPKKDLKEYFYCNLPTLACDIEFAAKKMLLWVLQESIVEEPFELTELNSSGSGEIENIYSKILKITVITNSIQERTYAEKEILRRADPSSEQEVVFEQTCPAINPLIYTRAYFKRRRFYAQKHGEQLEHLDRFSVLNEFLSHVHAYVLSVQAFVEDTIDRAGVDTRDSKELARSRIQFLNALKKAYHSWRIFSYKEIVPGSIFSVKLKTYIHTDSAYLSNDIMLRKDRYIKSRMARFSLFQIR